MVSGTDYKIVIDLIGPLANYEVIIMIVLLEFAESEKIIIILCMCK